MAADGLMQEFKDAALLLTAGSDGAPDAFAPLLPTHTACSLRNMAIQHDKTYRLLGEIIRWLQPWCVNKTKIGIRFLTKTFRFLRIVQQVAYNANIGILSIVCSLSPTYCCA
jgi:hypothetical protein